MDSSVHMLLRRLTFFSGLAWIALAGASHVGAEDVLSWPLVSVCQALANPQAFDGKTIRLQGVDAGSDEGSFLGATSQCSAVFKTGDFTWPRLVAVTAPDTELRLHTPSFVYDAQAQKIPFDKYLLLEKKYPDRCLLWTDAGLFETRTDWSKSRAIYPNGSSRYFGFGHDSAAPAQLLIKSIVDVEVDPRCAPRAR